MERQGLNMKNVMRLIFCLLVLYICILPCFAENPVVQTCYTADPAPLVHDGVVYLYVGHDSSAAPNNSYLMRYYKCYSSKDMVNWTDHGIVLNMKSVSWSGGEANAAQVAYRNGSFYFYTSTNATGGIAIGVAVSKSPLGPFTDIGHPLITASQMNGCNATHSWRGLDPAVFIDDDGQAYLYWGNNVLYWVKLNENMVSTSGTISCLDAKNAAFGPDFEEAPWVYKRYGKYYLVYASGFPESIHYSMSSSPTGPWTYKGQIMKTQPGGVSNTIHPGVVDFQGNSYFFFHNAGLPGGSSYRRSVCIEQFVYNEDGTIPLISETSEGVINGVGNLDSYDTIQAETICWGSGIETKPCSDGGIMVTSISDGDYIKVKGVDFGIGVSGFEVRAASGSSGGTIELRTGSQTGTLVGTCTITGTGGWNTWKTFQCDITNCIGIKDFFLVFRGYGEPYRLNWYRFRREATSVSQDGNDPWKHVSGNLNFSSGVELNVKGTTLFVKFAASEGKPVTLKFYNMMGEVVRSEVLQTGSNNRIYRCDISGIPSGFYIVKIVDRESVFHSSKVLVSH